MYVRPCKHEEAWSCFQIEILFVLGKMKFRVIFVKTLIQIIFVHLERNQGMHDVSYTYRVDHTFWEWLDTCWLGFENWRT